MLLNSRLVSELLRSFAFHLANIDPKKLDGGTFTSSSFLFLSLFRRVVQLSSSDPGRADTTTVLQPPPTVAHCCLKTTWKSRTLILKKCLIKSGPLERKNKSVAWLAILNHDHYSVISKHCVSMVATTPLLYLPGQIQKAQESQCKQPFQWQIFFHSKHTRSPEYASLQFDLRHGPGSLQTTPIWIIWIRNRFSSEVHCQFRWPCQ